MVESISTYGLYTLLLNGADGVQSSLSAATEQEASGLISQTFGGLGGVATSQTLNLSSEVSRANGYSANAATAGGRTQQMYTAIGNMITEMTSLKSDLSAATSATDNSTLASTVTSIRDDLADQMNTELDGRYLFAGSKTNAAPVDFSNYPSSGLSATTADTSYYQGDDTLASVEIGSQQSLTYGVAGDNTAFEQALRSATLAIQSVSTNSSGQTTTDSTTLSDAYTLASSALTALSNLQAEVSDSSSRLTTAQSDQATFVGQANAMITSLTQVDAAQATLDVTSYQTQLEASYSALATIFKTNLTSYL
jgi:flagellar hook-associated protein 3 FlgL